MELELFDYDLPAERIAQEPLADRAAARLFRLSRATGQAEHATVRDLPNILRPGDLLVLNDTAVVPAKLDLRRSTGGKVGGLFLCEAEPGRWIVLLNSKGRLRIGETLTARAAGAAAGHEDVTLTVERKTEQGQWEVSVAVARSPSPSQGESRAEGAADFGLRIADRGFKEEAAGNGSSIGNPQSAIRHSESNTFAILSRIGATPLPPYIRRERERAEDQARYQTVFARQPGAVAAPTAGLHFTEPLLAELSARGVERTCVTLHVGLGTFEPVRERQIETHRMHSEWFECPAAAADAVNRARSAGRRVVAVGTTSVRVLESCFDDQAGRVPPRTGWTDIFIYPGYRFRAADALLTNFHLPRSTLLMLVAAFVGRERILAAYREAIALGYRFYSYGDAMLIE